MKPKKLNLQEITKIYFLLKPSLDGLEEKMTIGECIKKILDESSLKALLECIHIMYDNNKEIDSYKELVLLLIESMTLNDLFGFVWFIKELRDGSSRQ